MVPKKFEFRLLLLLVLLLLPITACRSISVTGSPDIITRELNYSNFTEIRVNSSFEIAVKYGKSYSVSITINENLLPYLDIHQRGKVLFVGLEQPGNYTGTTQKAAIVMPDLQKLALVDSSRGDVGEFNLEHPVRFEISKTSMLYISSLKTDDAQFEILDGSEVSGNVYANNCSLKLNGSTAELAGSVSEVFLDASKTSEIRLANFQVQNAHVSLRDSYAIINTSGMLLGELSGGSELSYLGNPWTSIKKLDGSMINQVHKT